MRKTKILATLGPAANTADAIRGLIDGGANAFRLNFSHGDHDEHRARFEIARSCSEEMGRHIPLVQDLQGPKIRVDLEGRGPLALEEDGRVFLTTEPANDEPDTVRVAYPPLCRDVKAGEPILLDDGKIVLEAEKLVPPKVRCRILAARRR